MCMAFRRKEREKEKRDRDRECKMTDIFSLMSFRRYNSFAGDPIKLVECPAVYG
jgi:hypothetical protein